MLQKMVRDFAEREVAPGAADRDEREELEPELFAKMAKLGLTGIPFPEQYGGSGFDYLAYAIAVQELSRVCASTGVTLSAHISLAAWPIYHYGTAAQRERFLQPLASGTKMGAFGLTEPSAGSDAGATKTTAYRDGEHWVLNGTKIFITNAGMAEIYVIFASTDRTRGSKGISAFIVEKGTPGFTFGKKEKKLGIRASSTMELVFENCRVPHDNLLGELGQGFKIALSTLDGGRIGIAAQAVGIAQGALEQAINFSKTREQFGKPIAQFQGIQFMLADMATKVEAAKLLTYQAAYLESVGQPYGKAAAMAKLFASETAMEVTTKAVQIFGGYGYSREYPVERMMRDAKITEIYEGTSEVQRMVIASHLLR